MAEVSFREVYIEEILNIISENHKYTKRYIEDNKGKYPVFSATIGEPFGYVNNYDYEEMKIFCVVNYGSSGKTFRIFDEKFSIGRNICGLYVKDEYVNKINLEYVRVLAEPKFVNRAKGTKQKNLNQRLIKKTSISIPIDKEGNFDLEKQNEIVKKYEIVERRKKEIGEKLDYINEVEVDFLNDSIYKTKQINLEDLFEVARGKSKYTRTYCKNNGGEYPVYSADNISPLCFMNEYDYDGKYLTVSVNGIAGVTKIIDGKFSTNADRVTLIPKDDKLDIEYISHILERELRKIAKGRIGIKGKNEFTKLSRKMIDEVKIPIPVNVDGEYDIEKQKRLANEFKVINYIKENLNTKVKETLGLELIIK